MRGVSAKQCYQIAADLSSGLHALPDTKVADEPDDGQTQSQLPADWTQLI